jgi:predicted glycosyl hydrolase (DUF1957 family)
MADLSKLLGSNEQQNQSQQQPHDTKKLDAKLEQKEQQERQSQSVYNTYQERAIATQTKKTELLKAIKKLDEVDTKDIIMCLADIVAMTTDDKAFYNQVKKDIGGMQDVR